VSPPLRGGGGFEILPRKGEVAGSCQMEGEARAELCSVSAPSVTFGATSPWRGRIVCAVPQNLNPAAIPYRRGSIVKIFVNSPDDWSPTA